ncbi:hypothetical protein AB4238_12525 [Shewanella sp. 10N.286.45.A1]|uniref:hypothetical protein n=1 Tax=Shewanella sp. 10N.286.45.A1 TaxID=3229694 RepID=UPI0035523073
MYQDKSQQTVSQVIESKPQWVKPQLESLDLGATEGKGSPSAFELTPSTGPS